MHSKFANSAKKLLAVAATLIVPAVAMATPALDEQAETAITGAGTTMTSIFTSVVIPLGIGVLLYFRAKKWVGR